MATIQELIDTLDDDTWRKKNPFSPEVAEAGGLLLNPFLREGEQKEIIRGWLVKHQPCLFGRAAAQADRIFISIINKSLLNAGDGAVQEKLLLDKKTWKQWSLYDKGRHGFLAVFLSPELHHAAPNAALRALSAHLRQLFVSRTALDPAGNDVSYESVYLHVPETKTFRRFKVILDYFASAGDGRWWHDHRFPGGVAFTLNSLGHMARTKEWYEKLKEPTEWAAKIAMLTIAKAYPHRNWGKATRLLDLKNGKARLGMKCPFADPSKLPEELKDKDWTTYAGFHHTDHSVRREFFDQADEPDRSRGEYFLDFTYIAGAGEGENNQLMNGDEISEDEVLKDVGTLDQWRFAKPAAVAPTDRPKEQDELIRASVKKIREEWLAADVMA